VVVVDTVATMSLPSPAEFLDSLDPAEQQTLLDASQVGGERLAERLVELIEAHGHQPAAWQVGHGDLKRYPPAAYMRYLTRWASRT
jgi:hypothetical protein